MSIFIPAIQKLNLNPIFSIFTPAIQNFTKAQIFHIYPCYSICKKAQKHRFTLVFLLLLQMLSYCIHLPIVGESGEEQEKQTSRLRHNNSHCCCIIHFCWTGPLRLQWKQTWRLCCISLFHFCWTGPLRQHYLTVW